VQGEKIYLTYKRKEAKWAYVIDDSGGVAGHWASRGKVSDTVVPSNDYKSSLMGGVFSGCSLKGHDRGGRKGMKSG